MRENKAKDGHVFFFTLEDAEKKLEEILLENPEDVQDPMNWGRIDIRYEVFDDKFVKIFIPYLHYSY